MQKLKSANKWGIIALFLVGGLSFLSAYIEEYSKTIMGSPWLLVFFAVVFVICVVTALHMNTKFFIWLLVFGFFIGLLTQIMGTFNKLWIYTGPHHSYVFAGFSWAFAAVAMMGLSLVIRELLPEIDRKGYNVLALVILFLIVPFFLGELRNEVGLNFWVYYSVLFAFGLVVTYHLKFSQLLSLILAAWIMGIFSEYMGSRIGLWEFYDIPKGGEMAKRIACWFQPPYLIFGCWPLEFLAQVGLSAFISKERIFKD